MQSNGSQAAGYRSGIGGCPQGAGSDDVLRLPGLSGGCHPQVLQLQGLWVGVLGKPSRIGERVTMVTGRLIHLAHFRGSQRHPVLSSWVSPLVDLKRLQ